MNEPLLKASRLCVNFNGTHALNDFSFSLTKGKVLGLMGPNGAGKTTLLNVIGGFTKPNTGYVSFENKKISQFPPYKISRLGITRTFQKLRLIEQLSVLDNILFAFRENPGDKLINTLFLWKKVKRHEKENSQKALSLLADVKLVEFASSPASDLSYGQQKLLNLVCCLASPTKLLLLDEPVAGVTPTTGDKILTLIRELSAQGTSIVLIEHNVNALMEVSDQLIFMGAGEKICEGVPEVVCNDDRVLQAYLGLK